MLALLSPAKSLDLTSALPTRRSTQPRLLDRAEELVSVMRQRSPQDLTGLMGISDELAALNAQRFQDFATPFTARNARPAALAFNGDVYQGMAARERFDARDWTEAQKTVRILSGLYGLLRPLDLIQPYRLEMGLPVATVRGDSLYAYWGRAITDLVNEDLAASPGAPVLVDLASQEYARAVDSQRLQARRVCPVFLDADPTGRYRVVSFFAKRARGQLAAWLVQHRVRAPGAVRRFDADGYRYDAQRSTPNRPTFIRDARPG